MSIDKTFLIQMVIFLAVMITMNFWVFKPLGQLKEQRGKRIRDLDNELREVDNARNDKLSSYNKSIAGLKDEIIQLKTDIKQKIDSEGNGIIIKARKEAEEWLAKEEEELKTATIEARNFLNTHSRELASTIFTKIMGREPTGN